MLGVWGGGTRIKVLIEPIHAHVRKLTFNLVDNLCGNQLLCMWRGVVSTFFNSLLLLVDCAFLT